MLHAASITHNDYPRARILTCPQCNLPHIDRGIWATVPHRTHKCEGCHHQWRPQSYPTVGIEARRGGWIQTHSGRIIFPLDVRPEDIVIEDIAHALAHICRFTGHVRSFYSVAQHCVIVAQNVPNDFRLEALLHDASEMIVTDVNRIIKHSGLLEDYRQLERQAQLAIMLRFGARTEEPPDIKIADHRALATEHRDLMASAFSPTWDSLDGIEPFPEIIDPWPPERAKLEYLNYFSTLRSTGT